MLEGDNVGTDYRYQRILTWRTRFDAVIEFGKLESIKVMYYFSTILSNIFQSQSVEYYHILYYIIVKIPYIYFYTMHNIKMS